jgi:hypothetical protein
MVQTDRSPAFNEPSFVCPHCEAFAEHTWDHLQFNVGGSWGSTALYQARCAACAKYNYWLTVGDGHVMIWPDKMGGAPPGDDMPEDVRNIYDEARSIINRSPRAASALMRLALETLLTELYPNEGNLNATIGAASRAGLPGSIIQAMDVLRFNGNDAIHEINREDSPETAASLARILNLVVERLITEPRQIADLHAQLPAGVLAQIEQRDAQS